MKLSLVILNVISLCGLVAIALPSRANIKPVESTATPIVKIAPTPIVKPIAKPIAKLIAKPTIKPIATPKVSNLTTATPVTIPVKASVANTVATPVITPVVIPAATLSNRVSSNEVKILSPTTQSVTGDRATTIVLQYSTNKSVSLIVNGAVVDAKQIGRDNVVAFLKNDPIPSLGYFTRNRIRFSPSNLLGVNYCAVHNQ